MRRIPGDDNNISKQKHFSLLQLGVTKLAHHIVLRNQLTEGGLAKDLLSEKTNELETRGAYISTRFIQSERFPFGIDQRQLDVFQTSTLDNAFHLRFLSLNMSKGVSEK